MSEPIGTFAVDGDGQSAEITVTLEGEEQLPFGEAAITLTEVREPPLRDDVPSLRVDPSSLVPDTANDFTDLTPVNEPLLRMAILSESVGAVTDAVVDRELEPREMRPVVDVNVPPFKTKLK